MENIEAMLCAYIEGDLDPAGRAEIEKHLEANPQHRKLIAELIATRDMVRSLPRVKAPIDVGESLRGQVERSILLDDSAPRQRESRMRINRWPQFAAVAAVFVLTAGLGIIVFKMVMPTFKTPQFTIAPNSMPAPSPAPVISDGADDESAMHETTPHAEFAAKAGPAATFGSATNNALANATNSNLNVNLDAIENRLKISGYDSFDRNATVSNAMPSNAPVMMVFNNPAPAPADDKVTNFLKNEGITYMPIPDAATTQPAADQLAAGQAGAMAGGRGASAAANGVETPQTVAPPAAQIQAPQKEQSQLAVTGSLNISAPATSPSVLAQNNSFGMQNANGSNQDVIVALKMTRRQAVALRDQMSQQIGPVQVFDGATSLKDAATTRPSASVNVGGGSFNAEPPRSVELAKAMPATQPDVAIAAGDALLIKAGNLTIPEGEQVQMLKVDDQGKLSLPGLEPVDAAGNSIKQVQESLAKAYDNAKLSDNADVTVKKIGAKPADDAAGDKEAADQMDVVIVIQNGAVVNNVAQQGQPLMPGAPATTEPAVK